jgi:hypothetical protein
MNNSLNSECPIKVVGDSAPNRCEEQLVVPVVLTDISVPLAGGYGSTYTHSPHIIVLGLYKHLLIIGRLVICRHVELVTGHVVGRAAAGMLGVSS